MPDLFLNFKKFFLCPAFFHSQIFISGTSLIDGIHLFIFSVSVMLRLLYSPFLGMSIAIFYFFKIALTE